MTRDRRFVTAGRWLFWAALGACAAPAGAEDLLYYLDGGRVVITNTPSRPDARPVPGFRDRVAAALVAGLPPSPFDRTIELLALETGLSGDLIKAVAFVESGFDPDALSPKGAAGLMQLMPATAARYGVTDRFDPDQSLAGGARHLRDLVDEFDGDLDLALAAYNAGSGAVRRHRGIPAYPETRAYVKKVRAALATPERPESAREARSDAEISSRRLSDGTVLLTN